MRITVQTDYTLRMLMHLAINSGRLTTIAEVAERYGISKNHLMKVAHFLGKKNYTKIVRGRSGGIMLGVDPKEISVGALIRELEQGSPLVECFPCGRGTCKITSACRLKKLLAEAQELFFAHLDQFTVADLTTDNSELFELLLEQQDG